MNFLFDSRRFHFHSRLSGVLHTKRAKITDPKDTRSFSGFRVWVYKHFVSVMVIGFRVNNHTQPENDGFWLWVYTRVHNPARVWWLKSAVASDVSLRRKDLRATSVCPSPASESAKWREREREPRAIFGATHRNEII